MQSQLDSMAEYATKAAALEQQYHEQLNALHDRLGNTDSERGQAQASAHATAAELQSVLASLSQAERSLAYAQGELQQMQEAMSVQAGEVVALQESNTVLRNEVRLTAALVSLLRSATIHSSSATLHHSHSSCWTAS
jgi:chromosome segregation ATPase